MKLVLVVPRYGAEIVGVAETLVRRFARRLPRPEFDVTIFLIFALYLAGTTFYGATCWPERTLFWPCLHDEPFAHFGQTWMLPDACHGVIFLTEPEQLGRSGTPRYAAYNWLATIDRLRQAVQAWVRQ